VEVLARAEELHTGSRGQLGMDLAAVLRAAEEAGLPREAVEQAIREKLGAIREPCPGELWFAPSADGRRYVAEVLRVEEGMAQVRFLKGGQHSAQLRALQQATFLPGERIECPWPLWGWWGCNVEGYDAAEGKVQVNDGWGSQATFDVAEVRLPPLREAKPASGSRTRFFLILLASGFAAGGAIGSLATWLLTR
jgi:hypothetical protein